jgi:tetratricopeptide (TPR) repeat protein
MRTPSKRIFALGSLYRRRGEVERAIRIHQNLLARAELPQEHREQALLALARDYLRAGVLDRAEALLQQVSEVPRLRASALDALRGVYELQHDWQQALGALRNLERIKAAPAGQCRRPLSVRACGPAIERGDSGGARRLLREARRRGGGRFRARRCCAPKSRGAPESRNLAVRLLRIGHKSIGAPAAGGAAEPAVAGRKRAARRNPHGSGGAGRGARFRRAEKAGVRRARGGLSTRGAAPVD